jgi:hypothetical protein
MPIYQQRLEEGHRVKNLGSQLLQSKIQAKAYHNILFMSLQAAQVIKPSCYYSILRAKQYTYQCCQG